MRLASKLPHTKLYWNNHCTNLEAKARWRNSKSMRKKRFYGIIWAMIFFSVPFFLRKSFKTTSKWFSFGKICLCDIVNVPVFSVFLSDLCSDYLSCSISSDLNTNQSWCEFPFLKFHAFRTLAVLTQALPTWIQIFTRVNIHCNM